MKYSAFLLLVCMLTHLCQAQNKQEKVEYQSFGRCDGCEGIFEYGERQLQAVDTLPDFHQYEPKLKLSGTIYKPDGKTPAPGVILFIYHTNPEGKYPKRGNEKGLASKQGYIRGWIRTDSSGRYTFYTFMPGSYSSSEAHIHAALLEPNGKYYFIDDFNFEEDPYLNSTLVRRKWGGPGIIKLKQEGDILNGERNIILGLNIPGYE